MYIDKLGGPVLTGPESLHEHEVEPEKEHDKKKDSLPPLIKRLADLQKAQEGLEILREGKLHTLIAEHENHQAHDNGHDAHSDYDHHDKYMDKG